MKNKIGMIIIGLILFSSIFYACNPANQTNFPSIVITPEITPTLTPEIRTPEITPTSILKDRFKNVPVLKEMSCVPAENPFKKDTEFDKYLYDAMELPNIEIKRKCTFSGHIIRGEIYIHQFTNDLIFCLVPGGDFSDVPEEGWSIQITDSRSKSCYGIQDGYDNLGPIITPPYRGNMDFDIFGWYFRNKDNTGPNDGSVNAPQKIHEFNFLFDQNDYDPIIYSHKCANWKIPEDCTQATQAQANRNQIFFHSTAILTITDLTLGNLVKGSHAWIEDMDFTVDVYLPDEE